VAALHERCEERSYVLAMNNRQAGVTLPEILFVFIIISIVAALAYSGGAGARERGYGREAKISLNLIAASERDYRQRNDVFYPASGTVTDVALINGNLSLQLVNSNWRYSITTDASSCTVYADRNTTDSRYSGCQYSYVYNITDLSGVTIHPVANDATRCP
jgi:prepilin-type N-terminal cleavage/methylation domain-containing protein